MPEFLGFEPLARVPICPRLIDVDMLSPEEEQWLDGYHRECREYVLPLLTADADGPVREWLRANTCPTREQKGAAGGKGEGRRSPGASMLFGRRAPINWTDWPIPRVRLPPSVGPGELAPRAPCEG